MKINQRPLLLPPRDQSGLLVCVDDPRQVDLAGVDLRLEDGRNPVMYQSLQLYHPDIIGYIRTLPDARGR